MQSQIIPCYDPTRDAYPSLEGHQLKGFVASFLPLDELFFGLRSSTQHCCLTFGLRKQMQWIFLILHEWSWSYLMWPMGGTVPLALAEEGSKSTITGSNFFFFSVEHLNHFVLCESGLWGSSWPILLPYLNLAPTTQRDYLLNCLC